MEERKSVFRRGAECGLPVGVYLSVISLSSIYADKVSVLSVLALVMLLCGPILIYRLQRRFFVEENGMPEFSALWMHGILMVIYGALLNGAVTLAVLQWVRPAFLYEQAQLILDTYNAMPQAKAQFAEFLDVLQKMVDNGLIPRPAEVVFNMFWLIAFSGSVLSAITAAFAGRRLQ